MEIIVSITLCCGLSEKTSVSDLIWPLTVYALNNFSTPHPAPCLVTWTTDTTKGLIGAEASLRLQEASLEAQQTGYPKRRVPQDLSYL
jgi:hypothetical protein